MTEPSSARYLSEPALPPDRSYFDIRLQAMHRDRRTYADLSYRERDILTQEFLDAQPNPEDYIGDAVRELDIKRVIGTGLSGDCCDLGRQFWAAIVEECRGGIETELDEWADAQRHD